MRQVLFAELRGSWSTWLGVSLAFVVTNFGLVLPALVLASGQAAVRSGVLPVGESTAHVFNAGFNLVACAVVGAIVVGTATSLVVHARRGALARLALNGATPRQVTTTIMSQLAGVSILCSIVGAALAALLLRPALALIGAARADAGDSGILVEPVYTPLAFVAGTGLSLAVALCGGWAQARAAARIQPVEALRQHSGDSLPMRMTVARWIMLGVCALTIAGAFVAVGFITAERDTETFSQLLQVCMLVLLVSAAAITFTAPATVGPIARGWTSMLPISSPGWSIARHNVTARATRLVRSVVPVMLTIALIIGMLTLVGTMQGLLVANGFDVQLSASGIEVLLALLGLPLTIALAGGVASLVMMSKQRDADLALLGIVGATPAQRLALPALEALIITVTGAILALIAVTVMLLVMVVGLVMGGYAFAFHFPFAEAAVAMLVTFAIIAAATVLPTLRARSQPEPSVVARLIAD